MEKNKIMIIGLIIVIIALIAGIAIALTGNNNSTSDVSEGMELYNFDSAFTMEVPNGTKFIKNWYTGNETVLVEGTFKDYFSKDHEFSVTYIDSRMLNDERINYLYFEDLGNYTTEESGDYIIIHYTDATGKVGKTIEDCDFKETILIHKGSEIVDLTGNDLDFLKSMADTIKFKE